MENLQQIGSKFLFGTVSSLVENHDFSTVLLEKISKDFATQNSIRNTSNPRKLPLAREYTQLGKCHASREHLCQSGSHPTGASTRRNTVRGHTTIVFRSRNTEALHATHSEPSHPIKFEGSRKGVDSANFNSPGWKSHKNSKGFGDEFKCFIQQIKQLY